MCRTCIVTGRIALLLSNVANAQPSPSQDLANAQTNRAKIDYMPPTNPAHQPILDLLKKGQSLEHLQHTI